MGATNSFLKAFWKFVHSPQEASTKLPVDPMRFGTAVCSSRLALEKINKHNAARGFREICKNSKPLC
jgi:hypothetical protein